MERVAAVFLILGVTSISASEDAAPPAVPLGNDTLLAGEQLPLALPLAAPERSHVDEEQFNMAASYLKSQFSVPHHLVPSYQDLVPSYQDIAPSYQDAASSHTVRWSTAEDRIRRLPNIQNHQLDSFSDSSYNFDYEYIDTSNEFQNDKDRRFKRKPDLDYTWDQELEPEPTFHQTRNHKSTAATRKPKRSKKWSQHRQTKLKNKPRFPRNPIQFQNFAAKQLRPLPKRINFIAAMTSHIRNSLTSALNGNRRAIFPLGVQAGYLRRKFPIVRKAQPKMSLDLPLYDYDYDDYDGSWVPEDPGLVLPTKRLGTRDRATKQNSLSRQNQGLSSINLLEGPHLGKKRRDQSMLRKRRKHQGKQEEFMKGTKDNSFEDEKEAATEEINLPNDTIRKDTDDKNNEVDTAQNKQTFEGLNMDLWEDDVEDAPKPDYRTRWQDLNFFEEDHKKEDFLNKVPVLSSRRVSEVAGREKQNSMAKDKIFSENNKIGWGEKMWKEIKDDWKSDGGEWKKPRIRKRKKKKVADHSVDTTVAEDVVTKPNMYDTPMVDDDGARYLSAWADAGEILEETKFSDLKGQVTDTFPPSVTYNEVGTTLELHKKDKNAPQSNYFNKMEIKTGFPNNKVKHGQRRPNPRSRSRVLQHMSLRSRS